MQFMITAGSGESVTVLAENWMGAMSKAMAFFQMDSAEMVRWVCTRGADGDVRIEDAEVGHSWVVRPVQVVKVVAVAPQQAEQPEPEPEPEAQAPEAPVATLEPPPALVMPQTKLAPPVEIFSTESLAERLFDLSMDMAGSPPEEACRLALDLLGEFLPCEAACVIRGTHNDYELTLVAAVGPSTEALVGRTVPFGHGLVGMCFDAGASIRVDYVAADDRHLVAFHDEFDFEVRAVLCVPLIADDGLFGVLQLLNPAGQFEQDHVEAAESIGRTLATTLAGLG